MYNVPIEMKTYQVTNSKELIKRMTYTKSNFLVVGEDKNSRMDFIHRLKELFDIKDRIVEMDGTPAVRLKKPHSREFIEISPHAVDSLEQRFQAQKEESEEDISTSNDSTPSLLEGIPPKNTIDSFLYLDLEKTDFYSYAYQVYTDRDRNIGEIDFPNAKALLEYILKTIEKYVEQNYSHLTVTYYLQRVLPVIVEVNDGIRNISELKIDENGMPYIQSILYSETDEQFGYYGEQLKWTGYYPSSFRLARYVEEINEEGKVEEDEDDQIKREEQGELISTLLKKLEPFKKAAFIPKTKEVLDGCSPFVSKFGGRPAVSIEKGWPMSSDNEPLTLLAQIDLSVAPAIFRERVGLQSGYLQFFVDEESEEYIGEREMPFYIGESDGVILVNHLKIEDTTAPIFRGPTLEREFIIESWEEVVDYPFIEDIPKEIGLTDEEEDFLWETDLQDGSNVLKTKLLGHRSSIQSPTPSYCPKCGEEQQPLIQFVSEDFQVYLIADDGVLYINNCEKHKKVINASIESH